LFRHRGEKATKFISVDACTPYENSRYPGVHHHESCVKCSTSSDHVATKCNQSYPLRSGGYPVRNAGSVSQHYRGDPFIALIRIDLASARTGRKEDVERQLCRAQTKSFPQAQDMAVFPDAVHDILDLDSLLTPRARSVRDKTRRFMARFDPQRNADICELLPLWLKILVVLSYVQQRRWGPSVAGAVPALRSFTPG
jgi:hypothetical protein